MLKCEECKIRKWRNGSCMSTEETRLRSPSGECAFPWEVAFEISSQMFKVATDGVTEKFGKKKKENNQFTVNVEVHSALSDPEELKKLVEEKIAPAVLEALKEAKEAKQ